MIKYNIEYLQYSWYLNGLTIKSTRDINYKSTKRIIYFNYTKEKLKPEKELLNTTGLSASSELLL